MNQKKWLSFLSGQPGNASENHKTAKIYSKPLNSCKNVLDIGCGEGITLLLLKEKGIKGTGITLNKKDALKVFSKGNPVVIGDMHELPFKNESFDGVYSKDSFEHSFAPFIASKEFSRVLKKNGLLVLVMPEKEWIKEEYHFHCFTPYQIKSLMEKNDFLLKKASFNLFYDFYVFEKTEKKKSKEIRLIELNYFFWGILRALSAPFLKTYFKTKQFKS